MSEDELLGRIVVWMLRAEERGRVSTSDTAEVTESAPAVTDVYLCQSQGTSVRHCCKF